MLSKLNVAQKGLLLVVFPVGTQLLVAAFLCVVNFYATGDIKNLLGQGQILLKLNEISSAIARAAIFTLSNRDDAPQYKDALHDLDVFANQEVDIAHPDLNEAINHARMMRDEIATMSSANAAKREGVTGEKRKKRKTSRQVLLLSIFEFSEIAKEVVLKETAFEVEEAAKMSFWKNLNWFLTIAIAIESVAVATWLVVFFTNDFLNRLKIISENARRIATGGRLLEPLEDGDEIAVLDRTVHEVSRNLRELREQELSILDNASDVVCSLNSKLRFEVVNPASIREWGYTPEELLGRALVSIVADRAAAEQALFEFQRIADGGEEGKLDYRIRCKNGTIKEFRFAVSYVRSEQRFSCVVQDVTAQKEMERLKQQFTLMVSHDMRSPLTSLSVGMSMYLEGAHGGISENHRKEFTRIQSSIGRLTDLINDLLELGKLESDTLQIDSQPVRAYNVCSAAIDALETMASLAKIKVERPRSDGLMLGEEKRLVQAVVNLLSNSIKFAPAGSTVKIDVVGSEDNVEIRISDSGPGIKAEDRVLIFDKFSQSTSKSNVSIKSSGLGLAIVKSIVTAHGGEVGVDSEPGQGSSFWLRIPRATNVDAEEDL